jgi:hypothetical protein
MMIIVKKEKPMPKPIYFKPFMAKQQNIESAPGHASKLINVNKKQNIKDK